MKANSAVINGKRLSWESPQRGVECRTKLLAKLHLTRMPITWPCRCQMAVRPGQKQQGDKYDNGDDDKNVKDIANGLPVFAWSSAMAKVELA
ncbi:hypothetical protein ACLKA6_004137 [Drosophila palustris]